MTQLIFGTSGWSYKEWVGPFYEEPARMFSYYARFFNTAEINSTFYRYPTNALIYGLTRSSSPDFIFSAKLPRLITHQKRLDPDQKVRSYLLRFLDLLAPLQARGKLGCILIQLPPSFVYERDRENFEAFLELLPPEYEFAAEFRNPSWMRHDTWTLLKKHNVAYCIVDEPLLPPDVQITADYAYFRWHGRGARPWYDYHYDEKELAEWVPRIEAAKERVDKIYGYFNNHYHGYAIENCIEILEMLNAAKPEHRQVKERIIRHNMQERPERYEKRLDDFSVKTPELSIEDLLLHMSDKRRLERGRTITDAELVVEESSEEMIRAKIRRYTIEVNRTAKVLKHDCDDWRKGLGMKRLCKHVIKLFLILPLEDSRQILTNLIENSDAWRLQQ
ncbi:MAG: DUF72 domain-containing protein [Candidatus Bathyarchaeota archaeon]|nr:DUF72 domain-containing protein [Candidatus Bathyarchaeota archaeon]